MTNEELSYWGQPLYMTTITDNVGYPTGIAYPDGTITMCGSSNVGKKEIHGDVEITVVWDGAKPDAGRSKGRLLPYVGPRYVDSLVVFKHLARGGKDDGDEANTTTKTKRVGRNVTREKKTDRPKG